MNIVEFLDENLTLKNYFRILLCWTAILLVVTVGCSAPAGTYECFWAVRDGIDTTDGQKVKSMTPDGFDSWILTNHDQIHIDAMAAASPNGHSDMIVIAYTMKGESDVE